MPIIEVESKGKVEQVRQRKHNFDKDKRLDRLEELVTKQAKEIRNMKAKMTKLTKAQK
jgi:hypothetical protein